MYRVPFDPDYRHGQTGSLPQAYLTNGSIMQAAGSENTTWTIVPSMGRSFLSLAKSEDGSLVVTGLRIEAEASTVAIGSARVALRRSSMILRDVMVPTSVLGEYVVDVGDANFLATIILDGHSRLIDLVNADPIVFREHASGDWEFEPFDVTYTDPESGTWTVRLDRMIFSPIL